MKRFLLSYLISLIPCFVFSQNLGIGTTAPISKLHVISSAPTVATFEGGSSMYITLAEAGFNRGYIGSFAGNPEDVDFGTYGLSNGKLHLVTSASPRLTVMNNGNIGIGTTNAQQQLSVSAGMNIDQNDDNSGTTTNMLRFGSNSGEGIGSNRTPGIWSLDFYSNSLRRMTIANNGNIGINITNPSSKLEIRGALGFSSTTKRWEMNYDSTGGYFYIDEFGSARRLTIKNGGNVGLNTTNPLHTLDINGDLNIQNKILLNHSPGNSGQALISNGNSSAPSWESLALSNNDRFMFKTDFFNGDPTQFNDIPFTQVYAYSTAITYSNGIFTVNKSGFYSIRGQFDIRLAQPSSNNNAPFFNVSFSAPPQSLALFEGISDFVGTSAGTNFYDKLLPYQFNYYFPAGATFRFQLSVASGGVSSLFSDDRNMLEIHLIAE